MRNWFYIYITTNNCTHSRFYFTKLNIKLSDIIKNKSNPKIIITIWLYVSIIFITGSYVLAWKRGIAILTAGTVKVTPDARVRLVNGYTLQIENAQPTDAGDYICQIATLEPREITHHVDILSKQNFSVLVLSAFHLFLSKPNPKKVKKNITSKFMMKNTHKTQ